MKLGPSLEGVVCLRSCLDRIEFEPQSEWGYEIELQFGWGFDIEPLSGGYVNLSSCLARVTSLSPVIQFILRYSSNS